MTNTSRLLCILTITRTGFHFRTFLHIINHHIITTRIMAFFVFFL